ncbi:LOW QUALITY PROTEIN: claudin-4-like [Hyla sarda]|uniref:LOW QUALITY PROTEIN: claudin-4-like n=1 Tax=Hyla sarda TaxID=327740 RepID=UPI0024C29264|nr:LOW QUALITY PROTEIN: claudin-4-like [Hyla sarda]
MSMGLEILGVALSVIGWLGAVVSCALPMWKVTAFIGNNIVVAQIIWEGLWMNCVVQSTGQMQCKVYDSLLALPQDLQAARAMMVVSIVIAVLGVLISIIGAKCTNCVQDESAKAKIMIVSGVIFILSGLMTLIPVSWSANAIIRDFYNPLVMDAQKRELGASMYIGWAAAALLMLGGAMLCCTCPPKQEKYPASRVAYSQPGPQILDMTEKTMFKWKTTLRQFHELCDQRGLLTKEITDLQPNMYKVSSVSCSVLYNIYYKQHCLQMCMCMYVSIQGP